MPTIILTAHDGSEHVAEGTPGESLMSAALENSVPGIDGDCGGACACGTCHVYVSDTWVDRLPPAGPIEESMLSMRPDRQPNSRLACQIELTAELDGFAADMPEYQM